MKSGVRLVSFVLAVLLSLFLGACVSSSTQKNASSCPEPPTPRYGSWQAFNTRSVTQEQIAQRDLLKKMPAFESSTLRLPYHLYSPPVQQHERYPLVVYLHGGAGIGENAEHIQYRHALPFLASSNSLLSETFRSRFPVFILAPQCECEFGDNEWSSQGGAFFDAQRGASPVGKALEELVESMLETYPIDPARIYLTGISMGGAGAWDLAVRRPDLIAAAIPLAGHSPSVSSSQSLAQSKIPVWVHQGEGDENNPIEETQATVDALRNLGACTWLSRYPAGSTQEIDPGDTGGDDLQHTVWMRAYLNPDLWPWVLSIKKQR